MLGNDLYLLDGIKEISGEYFKSLILLYSEISSIEDINIYLKMLFLEKNNFKKISSLLSFINMSDMEFEKHLHILEKVELIKTYNHDNEYIFILLKPLNFNEFFAHPIYGRLLMKRVNRDYFYYLKSISDAVEFNYSQYKDISEKAIFPELNDWDRNKETDYRLSTSKEKDIVRIDSYFDIDHFMKNISSALFPAELRTNKNLNTIAKLADAYGINDSDMRRFLKDAISINPLNFDENKLNYLCKKVRGNFDDEKVDGYNVPCAAFLSKFQNGKELVPHDLNIIDQLVNKYFLKPEVVNVILEYSLNKCNNQLIPSFIYSIAANFNRNNIDTSTKALDILKQNKKKEAKSKDILPEYSSENNIKVTSEDLDKYLKKD